MKHGEGAAPGPASAGELWLQAARGCRWEQPSAADLWAIECQLGRPPRGVVAVARRCRFGQPQVIVSHPLPDAHEPAGAPGTPLPTLFWLTCPYLRRHVGRLEAAGWIGRLRAELAQRADWQAALAEVVRLHGSLRLALLGGTAARLASRHPALYQVLATSGVAGERAGGLKCLHAHLADFLARLGGPEGGAPDGEGAPEEGCQGPSPAWAVPNPIGQRVAQLLVGEGVALTGESTCWAGCEETVDGRGRTGYNAAGYTLGTASGPARGQGRLSEPG